MFLLVAEEIINEIEMKDTNIKRINKHILGGEEICPYGSTLTNCDRRSTGILCHYVLYGRSISTDVHLF